MQLGRRTKNVTGERFGKLVVQSHVGWNEYKQALWKCICDCGNITEVAGVSLRAQTIRSCGCLRGSNFQDLTGQRFAKLVVQHRSDLGIKGRVAWSCICDCGNTTTVYANHLKNGHTKSCGCLSKEVALTINRENSIKGAQKANTTHGHTRGGRESRAYQTYRSMLARCYSPKQTSYKHYGGRGITVCDRWFGDGGFENFLEDMGEPSKGLSLDRIDPNGNYESKNCRWATALVQSRNRRPCGAVDNLSDEVIVKEFHKRFPEVNIDILAERHSVLCENM